MLTKTVYNGAAGTDNLTRIQNGPRQIRYLLEEVLALAEEQKKRARPTTLVREGGLSTSEWQAQYLDGPSTSNATVAWCCNIEVRQKFVLTHTWNTAKLFLWKGLRPLGSAIELSLVVLSFSIIYSHSEIPRCSSWAHPLES
jgi:hypothetical protein